MALGGERRLSDVDLLEGVDDRDDVGRLHVDDQSGVDRLNVDDRSGVDRPNVDGPNGDAYRPGAHRRGDVRSSDRVRRSGAHPNCVRPNDDDRPRTGAVNRGDGH